MVIETSHEQMYICVVNKTNYLDGMPSLNVAGKAPEVSKEKQIAIQ